MVWPEWVSGTIVEFVVLENLASMIHFLAAFALTVIGCAKRFFWVYTLYELVTTGIKTAVYPGHTLVDWTWDLMGDIMEFLMGIGLAYVLGVESRIHDSPSVARICEWKTLLAFISALMAAWIIALLT